MSLESDREELAKLNRKVRHAERKLELREKLAGVTQVKVEADSRGYYIKLAIFGNSFGPNVPEVVDMFHDLNMAFLVAEEGGYSSPEDSADWVEVIYRFSSIEPFGIDQVLAAKKMLVKICPNIKIRFTHEV